MALPEQPPQRLGTEWPLLGAGPTWRTVDFISDLHLHASERETFDVWQRYLRQTPAQAVFILGDLFEVWVGDDAIGPVEVSASESDSFEQRCAALLKACAARRDVFFMRGNRDFLIGDSFTRACGIRLLHDPTVLAFAGERWLLSHGDALCLADTEYMAFRALVRSPGWQADFLAQPLEQRQQAARAMRGHSEAHKKSQLSMVDVDTPAALAWLKAGDAHRLIHGHTHRPADHALSGGSQRIVLSDWDMHARPPRAQVLRITTDSPGGPATMLRVDVAGT